MEVHIAVIDDETESLDTKPMNFLRFSRMMEDCIIFITAKENERCHAKIKLKVS